MGTVPKTSRERFRSESGPPFNNQPTERIKAMKVTVNWEALGKALCEAVKTVPLGALALPTQGERVPYTEGLTSLHGGFDFPTRRV